MQGTVRRLHERSPLGRPVAVEITTPDVGLEVGDRFAVLGTEISMTSGRVQWTGEPTGRAPTLDEPVVPRAGSHTLERRAWTDADRGRARELWQQGRSWQQIAAEIGCSKASVGAWLRVG